VTIKVPPKAVSIADVPEEIAIKPPLSQIKPRFEKKISAVMSPRGKINSKPKPKEIALTAAKIDGFAKKDHSVNSTKWNLDEKKRRNSLAHNLHKK